MRPDGDVGARDVDTNGIRFAVPIARVRVETEQVIAGQLGAEAIEHGAAGPCEIEQRASRRGGQRLEAIAPHHLIFLVQLRLRGFLAADDVGILHPNRVDVRPHRRGKAAQFRDAAGIVSAIGEEALRDEQHRLRTVDGFERRQDFTQPSERRVA